MTLAATCHAQSGKFPKYTRGKLSPQGWISAAEGAALSGCVDATEELIIYSIPWGGCIALGCGSYFTFMWVLLAHVEICCKNGKCSHLTPRPAGKTFSEVFFQLSIAKCLRFPILGEGEGFIGALSWLLPLNCVI